MKLKQIYILTEPNDLKLIISFIWNTFSILELKTIRLHCVYETSESWRTFYMYLIAIAPPAKELIRKI